MNQIKDYIHVIPNALTPEVCDAILAEYKNSGEWVNSLVNGANDYEENLNIRSCQTIGISAPEVVNKNFGVRKKLDHDVFDCATQVINEYKKLFLYLPISKNVNIEDSGYELLKYETGGFYKQHIDSFKTIPRIVSCSFILNDGYEGGEFAFFNQKAIYKINKGACIMFPSNFMYPHEIMPVTSGTRYSIVTWFV
jgi:predicted 2-oxoglutarate/Fe(II)-dependent dioxygenase YbiX